MTYLPNDAVTLLFDGWNLVIVRLLSHLLHSGFKLHFFWVRGLDD